MRQKQTIWNNPFFVTSLVTLISIIGLVFVAVWEAQGASRNLASPDPREGYLWELSKKTVKDEFYKAIFTEADRRRFRFEIEDIDRYGDPWDKVSIVKRVRVRVYGTFSYRDLVDTQYAFTYRVTFWKSDSRPNIFAFKSRMYDPALPLEQNFVQPPPAGIPFLPLPLQMKGLKGRLPPIAP